MLVNDDVIVRTPGWDTAIYRTFARFGDDIALVHVNDLLFQERLCTFPVLSAQGVPGNRHLPGLLSPLPHR